MKPQIRTKLLAALFLASCCHAAPPLIALDVGHSLAEPGAISARGIPEFRFNSELAEVIHQTLTGKNIQAVLIGATGDIRDLKQRTREARAIGASFLLSIHHDSAQADKLQTWEWNGITRLYTDKIAGFSLFVSRLNPHTATSLKCASAIGAALRKRGFAPTPHHAETREWADEPNGVYYFDHLVVLKTSASPAVLFEAGVILNPAEERRLQVPEVRQGIADAIDSGLIECGISGKPAP